MKPTCDAEQTLRGAIGTLYCHREPGHPGMHRDNAENLYWHAGAPPLEVIEIPQAREIDPALGRTLGRLRGGIEL
ncbi:hypothetical protein PBI_TEAMOCIL_7 [Microbacterium phage Teamocil]|uniref:Uncharacterized protein n=1 Tax=Microbacterium phage Teamocil TaxID=2656554 RepID=A0A649VYH0_9CAUD|nr:hypothetical protein QDA12_gp07 [Microbacterium phage Teamocil]QGJ88862.1 hypothetical protein PBI_GINA_7 [Microbacterium phage Gina]QGJ96959.1 hypothetical protein PBI_TEAMOCIL_7 [Microbacterium phage Teamocil]